jgi:ankyrin repeat protein
LSGIDYDLTVEMKMDTIENPLHDAARRGNIEFLQDCLSNGVSPTGLDSTGNSPIHWSARGGHADCLQVLVEAAIKQFTSAKQFINAQVTTS